MLAEGDDLVLAATAGEIDQSLRGSRVPAPGTVASQVMRSGSPERISRDSQRSTVATALLGIEFETALVVPLEFRGRAIGVLTGVDRLEGGPQFNHDDEELMLSFAASAATAVHTARSVGEERLRLAIEGAELERQRWARELHDETLQGLGSLQMLLSSALRQPDAEKREQAVRSTLEHVSSEIDKLRNLITELRPAELDELGLESALESLAHRRQEQSGMEVALDIDLGDGQGGEPRRLDPPTENTIYRLVQEALSNAAKHAQAERADIRVTALPGTIELVVSDNGHGFDPGESTSGFGLLGMRERVELGRGTFQLESVLDAGTTLHVTLPFSDEEDAATAAS
jgi:signal transduction histidine kinase